MTRLVEHPYLLGLLLTLLLAITLRLLPSGTLAPGAARVAGLAVFGGALAFLMWKGLDRGDVFWFVLGGSCGILLALPLVV
jgi:hypothetical protein